MKAKPVGRLVTTVLWQWMREPGLEHFELFRERTGWAMYGTIIVLGQNGPAVVEYTIRCDNAWRTRNANIARHRSPELIFARTCYDHLAGELGVAILSGLLRMQYLEEHSANYRLTSKGQAFITALGIDVSAALSSRRRFAYPCLDWSERVPHLGGALCCSPAMVTTF